MYIYINLKISDHNLLVSPEPFGLCHLYHAVFVDRLVGWSVGGRLVNGLS